jgi:hypothetical protein
MSILGVRQELTCAHHKERDNELDEMYLGDHHGIASKSQTRRDAQRQCQQQY